MRQAAIVGLVVAGAAGAIGAAARVQEHQHGDAGRFLSLIHI